MIKKINKFLFYPDSIQPISPAFADAARLEGRTVRLKLAYELLDVNPHKFVFSGKRKIRGNLKHCRDLNLALYEYSVKLSNFVRV